MRLPEENERILDAQEVDLEEAADKLISRRKMLEGIGKTARGLAMMAGVLTFSVGATSCGCTVDSPCTSTCNTDPCKTTPCKTTPCATDPCDTTACKDDPCSSTPCMNDPCQSSGCGVGGCKNIGFAAQCDNAPSLPAASLLA